MAKPQTSRWVSNWPLGPAVQNPVLSLKLRIGQSAGIPLPNLRSSPDGLRGSYSP